MMSKVRLIALVAFLIVALQKTTNGKNGLEETAVASPGKANSDSKYSNPALFGSDLERNISKEAAEQEPAWKGAGTKVGLQIWRIVNFKVTHWPKRKYGQFYDGDSYIILNTYKDPKCDALCYDVHYWIGKDSTSDEYYTAAYKAAELVILLDGKPIQHREVMYHESDLFKSYFKGIIILNGGADSSYNTKRPEGYKTRLLEFQKVDVPTTEQPFENVLNRLSDSSGQLKLTEVSRGSHVKRSQLSSDDVFILETEEECFVWIGKASSIEEKQKCFEYAHNYMITSVHPFNPITTFSEGKETDSFNRAFN